MGFLRKKFKQIKKGIKKVFRKAGEFFDKIGPLGSVALMIAAPYAANAMFGTSFKTVSSMFGKGAKKAVGEEITKEATTELAKEAGKEVVKETAKREAINSAAGNAAQTLLDSSTNLISDNVSEVMSQSLDESLKASVQVGVEAGKAAAGTTKVGQAFGVTGGPVKQWFGDVGSAIKNHYTDLLTPESLKEGTVDLATGYVESTVMTKGAEALGLIGDEDISTPRAGIVKSQPTSENAQSFYMQEVQPVIAQTTGQTFKNYQDLSNQNLYGNITPDFLGAFSQPLFTQEILPLPKV